MVGGYRESSRSNLYLTLLDGVDDTEGKHAARCAPVGPPGFPAAPHSTRNVPAAALSGQTIARPARPPPLSRRDRYARSRSSGFRTGEAIATRPRRPTMRPSEGRGRRRQQGRSRRRAPCLSNVTADFKGGNAGEETRLERQWCQTVD